MEFAHCFAISGLAGISDCHGLPDIRGRDSQARLAGELMDGSQRAFVNALLYPSTAQTGSKKVQIPNCAIWTKVCENGN